MKVLFELRAGEDHGSGILISVDVGDRQDRHDRQALHRRAALELGALVNAVIVPEDLHKSSGIWPPLSKSWTLWAKRPR